MRRAAIWSALALLAALASSGCKTSGSAAPDPAPTGTGADMPPARSPAGALPAVTVTIVYGSEKKTWLEEQARAFEGSGAKTASGRPIHIDARAMGSGEALQAIESGSVKADVFSPASSVYLSLLNDEWQRTAGHTRPVAPKSDVLVLSPVVVAMWQPMAEALGWPKKHLSWNDLIHVNASPKGWGAVGYPEWGRFKLGHCHPDYSNSGFLSVLAEAYAGAKKTRELTAADLDAKATADFVASVEQTIVHYGKSTGFFADKMVARGPSYLSAAVLYENLVIESYGRSPPPSPSIVAIYPLEGTFWSDHPYAVLDADWVGADERDASAAFLAYLKARPAQERALALGFRPADPQIPVAAPIDAAHGVDPKEPQTVLPVPPTPVLTKLQDLWNKTKKGADVTIVFDKSGSMEGAPLQEAKAGARAFVQTLGDRDEGSLLFFDSAVYPPFGPLMLSTGRSQLFSRIDGVAADGGTALYDAIAAAYDAASRRAAKSPAEIHAVVVMTDGADENSKMTLPQLTRRFPKEESPVKVFTIAYGQDAQSSVLDEIAEAAKGSSARGSVETIRDVYRDMASFF